MKNLAIFEPAMCCSTGLCGVGVDPELLRISTVLNSLEKNGVYVKRYNLTSAPREFVKNKEVNKLLKEGGVEILPITVLDGEIVKSAAYPSNDEIISFLDIPKSYLAADTEVAEESVSCGCECGCDDGKCC